MKIRIMDITDKQPVVRMPCGCLVQLRGPLTNAAFRCDMLEDCRYIKPVAQPPAQRTVLCRVFGASPWVYDFEQVEYDPLATALAECFG